MKRVVQPAPVAVLVLAGWLAPGGAYLFSRRYARFAICFALVCGAFLAGVALNGGMLWPAPAELEGLDGFTVLIARAGAAMKALAGGPYLLARLFHYSQTYAGGFLHEHGTTLLALAGLINMLALTDALELRKPALKKGDSRG